LLHKLHRHILPPYRHPSAHSSPLIDCAYGAFYYLGSECDHLPEAGNNYLGSECDHLPEAGNIYIGIHPTIPPEAANVAKLIRRRRISSKRDNHPQNPSVKSMAPSALATATSPHRANATTAQRSAPRKCNQSAEVRASHPVEVRASHPVQRPRSAPRKCNQSVEVLVRKVVYPYAFTYRRAVNTLVFL